MKGGCLSSSFKQNKQKNILNKQQCEGRLCIYKELFIGSGKGKKNDKIVLLILNFRKPCSKEPGSLEPLSLTSIFSQSRPPRTNYIW